MRKQVYECDRCRETTTVDVDQPPEKWMLFKVSKVPAGLDLVTNLQEALKPSQHLCDTCAGELLEWLGLVELRVIQDPNT